MRKLVENVLDVVIKQCYNKEVESVQITKRKNKMGSQFSRVKPMRTKRVKQEKATCKNCKITYNDFKFLNADGVCYECDGYDLDTIVAFFNKAK